MHQELEFHQKLPARVAALLFVGITKAITPSKSCASFFCVDDHAGKWGPERFYPDGLLRLGDGK